MKNPIETFEPNLVGKDYVIGDLHGCFDMFLRLLEGIDFDPAVDRMFSVGDLVDRGKRSRECLGLIREGWFHSTLANHEQLMIQSFAGDDLRAVDWIRNGGMWGFEALNKRCSGLIPTDEESEIWDLVKEAEELPFLITVKMPDGKKFHIIHAEMLGTQNITDEDLADPVTVYRMATTLSQDRNRGDSFLWSRYHFGNFSGTDLVPHRDKVIRAIKLNKTKEFFSPEMSHIISGHTVLQRPMTLIGQTNIDTGAYYAESYVNKAGYTVEGPKWAGLTCVDLQEWKFYQATETEFREIEPFVVTREDVDAINKEPQ